jgi:ribosomal protein L5
MPLKTVVVRGSSSAPIKFDIGLIFPDLSEGKWEISVESVGLLYSKPVEETIASLTVNLVMGKSLTDQKNIAVTPEILGQLYVGGRQGKKAVVSFKHRVFHAINNVSYTMEVELKSLETKDFIDGLEAIVLCHVKRVA